MSGEGSALAALLAAGLCESTPVGRIAILRQSVKRRLAQLRGVLRFLRRCVG